MGDIDTTHWISDEEIMVVLCCGEKCKPGKNTGLCHRWDFENEAKRVRVLLDAKVSKLITVD